MRTDRFQAVDLETIDDTATSTVGVVTKRQNNLKTQEATIGDKQHRTVKAAATANSNTRLIHIAVSQQRESSESNSPSNMNRLGHTKWTACIA